MTCENFIELCEQKYYNNTKFHRLIRNFMIQGGDPTGTGKGGKSIFGKKFEDEFHIKLEHNKRGVLSMANSGKHSNGSQFFITLRACSHLDDKHSVFGDVVGGIKILEKFNNMDTDLNERPIKQIKIFNTTVYQNPFRKAIKIIIDQKNQKQKKQKEQQKLQEEEKFRWVGNKKETIADFLKKKNQPNQNKIKNFTGTKRGKLVSSILDMPASQPKKKLRMSFNFKNW